jgi:hypothetical protein
MLNTDLQNQINHMRDSKIVSELFLELLLRNIGKEREDVKDKVIEALSEQNAIAIEYTGKNNISSKISNI